MKYLILKSKLQQACDKNIYNFLPYYAGEKDLSIVNEFLDNLISKKSNDIFDLLFSDKVAIAKALVLQHISLIKEREIIKRKNIARIEVLEDEAKSRMVQLESFYIRNYIFFEDSKTRTELEKRINDLEKQINLEVASCWKDVVIIKKDLMAIMSEYKSNVRKDKLLSLEGIKESKTD